MPYDVKPVALLDAGAVLPKTASGLNSGFLDSRSKKPSISFAAPVPCLCFAGSCMPKVTCSVISAIHTEHRACLLYLFKTHLESD